MVSLIAKPAILKSSGEMTRSQVFPCYLTKILLKESKQRLALKSVMTSWQLDRERSHNDNRVLESGASQTPAINWSLLSTVILTADPFFTFMFALSKKSIVQQRYSNEIRKLDIC